MIPPPVTVPKATSLLARRGAWRCVPGGGMTRRVLLWISVLAVISMATPAAHASRCAMPASQADEALMAACCCPAPCLEPSTALDLQPTALLRSHESAGALFAATASDLARSQDVSAHSPIARFQSLPLVIAKRYLTLCTFRL